MDELESIKIQVAYWKNNLKQMVAETHKVRVEKELKANPSWL